MDSTHRLRDPARAQAATALYRALAVNGNRRAAAGAYRGTRLVTPTLSLYGTVLYDGNRDTAGHPGILHGYEPYADEVTLTHVPGSGYYLAEEQPEAVLRHMLGFLAVT
jgi:pimeloyl-ACP methyl ester carboxylesterase